MSGGFTWTGWRHAQLRDLAAEGKPLAIIAQRIGHGCTAEDCRARLQVRKAETVAVATVPRPIARAAATGLIDLSTAPSLMEQRMDAAARKAGR